MLALSALMLGSVVGGPANAATNATAAPAVKQSTELAAETMEAQPGSLFYQVEHATGEAEKVRLLEKAGFTETADLLDGLAYEKTEGGITLGYVVEPPVTTGQGKEASADGRVGWDSTGPYVAATLNEWKQWVLEGAIVGGAACGLITLAFGIAACAAAAGIIGLRVANLDTGKFGNTCYAYRGPNRAFLPYPGAC